LDDLGDMLSVDGDDDAVTEARVRNGWNKFRQLVPLFASTDGLLTSYETKIIQRLRVFQSKSE